MNKTNPRIASLSGREFTCFPVALVGYVINENKEFLFLSRQGEDSWEIPSGAMEASENTVDGILRELHEELGDAIKIKPLGVVHAHTFPFDEKVKEMISIGFLIQYLGGEINPSDDMKGAGYKWMSLEEISLEKNISVPRNKGTLFERATELFNLWKDEE